MNKDKLVLCVDDEPNVLRSYRRALRNEPYEVVLAQSGKEALDLVKSLPIAALITDYRMPGMNGVELLQEALVFLPKMVCAVLSGYADETSIKHAVNRGQIYRFLLKPIDNNQLKDEIRELLAKSGQ